MTPDPGPIAAADRLAGALDAMTEQLKTVTGRLASAEKYGRRNRVMIWLTAASIAAVAVLAVLLVLVYGSAQTATTRADAAAAKVTAQHQSLLVSCRAGNASRATQVALWDRVLAETATNLSAKTPEGQRLLAYIRSAFKARDCQALYRLP